MAYVEVAVATDAPFRRAFSYRVPDGMVLAAGEAVLVPFGRHRLNGVVLTVSDHCGYDGEVRDVLLAGERLLLPHQVELARWVAQRYFAPVSECVSLMLPPEANRRLTEMVEWTGAEAPPALSPADARLAERLAASGRATAATLRRSFGGGADAAIERLVAAGAARRLLMVPAPPITERRPGLPSEPPPLSHAQRAAVSAIAAALEKQAPAAFLLHGITGSGKTEVYLAAVAAARALRRRAIVLVPEIALTPQTVQRFEGRFPGAVAVSHSGLAPALRYRQWHEVRDGRAAVVVGARGALFLPQPDLGLIVLDEEHEWSYKQQDPAPRYHARDAALKLAALTGAVVVLGSATPDVVSYWRAERGRYTLLRLPERVVGPVTDLSPRPLEGLRGSPSVVLRSRLVQGTSLRTPGGAPLGPQSGRSDPGEGLEGRGSQASVDHAKDEAPLPFRALRGDRGVPADLQMAGGEVGPGQGGPESPIIRAAEEPARYTAPMLPAVTIVDLAAELRAGNRDIFSRMLDEALAATLRGGEQAILFLNRRGSASFVLCRDCGHVPRCAGCLVPFTYHAGGERLRCHHCNRQRRVPQQCPQCGGKRIRYLGLGTQRVEEEVGKRFPRARVLRWDRDAARTGADHAALLGAFARREADVLVGTQMIAKGLDLPGVTLVGVVNADIALNLPDFRAGERAFQVLTQVAGRAGRGDRAGRVIIQTYSPSHYAVRAAAGYDYASMYRAEIELRRRAGYPPFGRLARLVYAHTNAAHAEQEARRLARELLDERARRGIPGVQVIGPAPALFERLRGRWRWQIVLRAADPAELLRAVELPRGWVVDIDPATLS